MITKKELIEKLTDLWNEQAKNHNDEKDYFTGISNALELVRQLPDSERGECEAIYCKKYDLSGYKCFNCSNCGAWHVDTPNTKICAFCGDHNKGRPNPRERGGE